MVEGEMERSIVENANDSVKVEGKFVDDDGVVVDDDGEEEGNDDDEIETVSIHERK